MTLDKIMKGVQRKYPVCSVIDARDNASETLSKCETNEREIHLGRGKTHTVTVCAGSYNVYILKIVGEIDE